MNNLTIFFSHTVFLFDFIFVYKARLGIKTRSSAATRPFNELECMHVVLENQLLVICMPFLRSNMVDATRNTMCMVLNIQKSILYEHTLGLK